LSAAGAEDVTALADDGRAFGFDAALPKPFSVTDLAGVVDATLRSRRPEAARLAGLQAAQRSRLATFGRDGGVLWSGMRATRHTIALAAVLALGGCGSSDTGTTSNAAWKQGVFEPSSTFANQCASPRTGIDPSTGKAYADKAGSAVMENLFLRSWTNELYLWYREVPDTDPSGYTTANYFNVLKTSATTPSGRAKDRFHFTYSTADWIALSQSGVEAGYGANWVVLASTPPRSVVVAYTDPGTPAASVGLSRGAQVLTVDGVDLVNAADTASVNTLNAGLFPSAAGASHTFTVQDLGSSTPRTITMVSASVTSTPVQNVTTIPSASGTVGYMLFNDHIATAEKLLVDAFSQLKGANVSDLVLDIRYNGGGYLDIASEVAYMVAGPAATSGRTFEKTVFNDKYPTKDPVTGQTLTPILFHTTTQGFSGTSGQALPTLNLSRVVLLTGSNTCSASESIVNGLRGVGVQVIEVGGTTCGKPYGFYPEDNCGTTYFSIQFQGVNDQGFGDYPDGFSPANATGVVGVTVPGCSVADDFGHALGDRSEARLAAALGYLVSPGCPAVSVAPPGRVAQAAGAALNEGQMFRSPLRENRILRR
jgi:carboxyl-terminal processing protease